MPYDLTRWRRRLEPLLDPFVALAVLGLTLLPLLDVGDGCTCPPVPWWGYLLAVAQCAPLAVRRRYPFAAPLVTGIAVMLHGVSEVAEPPVSYASLVAVYTIAAYAARARANAAAGIAVAGVAAVFAVDWGNWDVEDLGSTVLLLATAWLLGETTRSRHDRTVQAEARAEQLERARLAESEAAVAAERNRIARELHDVVAHHVAMMVVQAEAGPVVVHADPDRAAATFDTISAAGKQALAEMRRLLGVLREDEAAPLAPQPGVATLPALVEGVRDAGLDVRLQVDGPSGRGPDPAGQVPASVDLAAYRLVQEALTNCLRHSRAQHVEVEVGVGERAVTVRVSDDGVGGSVEPRPGGHGLVAMGQRVQLVGGRLTAGPREGGGWSVEAELPLSPVAVR